MRAIAVKERMNFYKNEIINLIGDDEYQTLHKYYIKSTVT